MQVDEGWVAQVRLEVDEWDGELEPPRPLGKPQVPLELDDPGDLARFQWRVPVVEVADEDVQREFALAVLAQARDEIAVVVVGEQVLVFAREGADGGIALLGGRHRPTAE